MAAGLMFDLAKVSLLFVAAVIATFSFEDARHGYLFLFHENNDLIVVEKDDKCYYLSPTDLKTNSLYHFTNVTATEDEIIKLLTGATPATSTLTDPAAMLAHYQDEFVAILCHSRQQFQVAVGGPPATTSPGSVTPSTTTSVIGHGTLPAINCSFEQGLCGWTQSQTDALDWTVGRGSTPTSDTGPDADHTLNSDQGHYLYLEATGTAPHEGAELLSPSFTLTSDLCVSLWFSMFGEDVDRLEIVTRDSAGNEDVLWSRSGNQGQGWNKVEVTLTPSSSEKQLVIRTQTGSSVLSDVGVDDVQAVSGVCRGFVTQECISQPCVNGGSCTQGVHTYFCSCAPGYTGANCQTDVNECASSPCHHGTCLDGPNSFTCLCHAGYHGTLCENDLDDCISAPCLNGTCHDGVNNFTCTCTHGYLGARCEIRPDDCTLNPDAHCQNGGVCVVGVNSFHCDCPPGFSGDLCTQHVYMCTPDYPCHHGGTCHGHQGYSTCECPHGYTGHRCGQGDAVNHGTCGSNNYQCHNGKCVSYTYTCDGDNDCGDNSDETLTECPDNMALCTGQHQFKCHNGHCVSIADHCDGYARCQDGSDETNCHSTNGCAANQFRCSNGQCIADKHHCNGHNQCHDGSDEINCPCPRDQFDCGGHLCIPSSYHCDSYCNCYDGCADEEHCRYG